MKKMIITALLVASSLYAAESECVDWFGWPEGLPKHSFYVEKDVSYEQDPAKINYDNWPIGLPELPRYIENEYPYEFDSPQFEPPACPIYPVQPNFLHHLPYYKTQPNFRAHRRCR